MRLPLPTTQRTSSTKLTATDNNSSAILAQPWAQRHPNGFNNQRVYRLLEQPPYPSRPLNPSVSASTAPHVYSLRPASSKVSIMTWDWFMMLYYVTHLILLSVMATEYSHIIAQYHQCFHLWIIKKHEVTQSYLPWRYGIEKCVILEKISVEA